MSLKKYQDTLSTVNSILTDCNENNLIDIEHCMQNILTPVKLAVFASYSAGKSTFLNALIFKDRILHMDIGEATTKVFSISYDEVNSYNHIPYDNMQELSEHIKISNKQKLEKPWLVDVKVNLKDLRDLIIIDTPGFGGQKEEELADAIGSACEAADGFLFLFDVSKGASKDDIEKYKKYIETYDKKTTIWTIFNKLDAEDDKTETEICSLIAKTLVEINIIASSEQSNYDSYEKLATKRAFALSSKKFLDASAGTIIKGGIEKKLNENDCADLLLESRGTFFSEQFYSEITKNKLFVLQNRINDCINEIDSKIFSFDNTLINNRSEREYLNTYMLDDINFINNNLETTNNVKIDLKKLVSKLMINIDYLNSSAFEQSINAVKAKIINSLEENILVELKEYKLIGGDNVDILVSRGVKNAEKGFSEIIQKEFDSSFQKIATLVTEISLIVDLYNKNSNHKQKLQSINALKCEQLGQMILEIENKTHNFATDDESKVINDTVINTILGAIGSVVAGLVATQVAVFVAQRLAVVLIPGLGWAIGGILALWSVFGGEGINEKLVGKITPKLKELLSKEVAPEITTKLKYEFKTKIENDLIAIKNQLESNVGVLETQTTTNSKELNEKKEELANIMSELTDKTNDIIKKISSLELCKQKLNSMHLIN